jgi:ribonuclease HI
MVRFASGAFVTSPIDSIMAEAGALPFNLLATEYTARSAIQLLRRNRTNSTLPLIRRAMDCLPELTDSQPPTITQVSTQTDRSWHLPKPSIVWEVKKRVRAGDPPEKVRPVVQQLLASRFHQSVVVYTDGSKDEDSVGAAYYTTHLSGMFSLPKQFSIFSAEAYAIKMAVSIPNLNKEIAVFTDSASCLLAIESGTSKHPLIQDIENIARNKLVRFVWIPGHSGIKGNLEADRLANEARKQPVID